MKLKTIVFSMDRGCQLDCLLNSMELNAPWLLPATVLYRASDEVFEDGYNVVREYHSRARFLRQLPFREKTLAAVAEGAPEYVGFFCDDSIVYRPAEAWLPEPGELVALNLGKNNLYCYPLDQRFAKAEDNPDTAYGYSVDARIFRPADVPLGRLQFNTPNTLEAAMTTLPQLKIRYPEHSVVVTVQHNRIQTDYPNRHEGGTVVELNGRFLKGERINFKAMDFSAVESVQAGIEYAWSRR